MPKLNVNDPGARDYLVKAALHWLDMGIDGFRLDHAHCMCARGVFAGQCLMERQIQRRALLALCYAGCPHSFWADFYRRTVHARGTIAFGEVTLGGTEIRSYAGTMDGALDRLLHEV